jgi:cytochrome c biogenesis protein
MSELTRSAGGSVVDQPADGLDGGLSISPIDLFDRVWHFFISMRTGLALILALAILTLIGTLLAQAPAGLQADKEAYAAWLDGVRPKYGGWTAALDALGFFSIFSSLLFRSLVVLLSTSIMACSINRAPKLWKQAVHPRVTMSPGFFDHASLRSHAELASAPAQVAEALGESLKSHHFRTIVRRDGDAIHVYADRFRWGPFGTVIAHLSIILIFVGALLGAGGFRNSDFAVAVGSVVDVGSSTDLSVGVTSFSDSYYEDGRPSDYASHLVVYRAGAQVAEQTIRVNDPLRYGDVTFYQSFFGPAIDLQIKDVTGAVLFDRGVPLQWTSNDGTKAIGQLALAGRNLTVYVVGAASGQVDTQIRAGQVQLELYDTDGNGVAKDVTVISQGQPATIEGLDFTFVRERQFTGLIVARDPGAPFIWGGATLLVLGVALVFFFPNRRLWAQVVPSRDGSRLNLGAVIRHDMTFESSFTSLVTDVKLALNGPSAA